jgi:hypothetical protein
VRNAIVIAVGVLVAAAAANAEDSPETLIATLTDDLTVENRSLADRIVARGGESIPPLVEALGREDLPGRVHAISALGRTLRATGLTPPSALACLRAATERGDRLCRIQARVAIRDLDLETPLDREGVRDVAASPRRLVGALVDGESHGAANDALLDRLLLRGRAALLPLVQAACDPDFEGRAASARALRRLARVVGGDPGAVEPPLVGDPVVITALFAAPPPDAPIEDLIAALGDRSGCSLAVVSDRIVMRGADAILPLLAAMKDGANPGAAFAPRVLGRVLRATDRRPEGAMRALRGAFVFAEPRARWCAGVSLKELAEEDDPMRGLRTAGELIPFLGCAGAPDRFLCCGKPAIAVLAAATEDPANGSRDVAAFALAKLLRATGERPPGAVRLLVDHHPEAARLIGR